MGKWLKAGEVVGAAAKNKVYTKPLKSQIRTIKKKVVARKKIKRDTRYHQPVHETVKTLLSKNYFGTEKRCMELVVRCDRCGRSRGVATMKVWRNIVVCHACYKEVETES